METRESMTDTPVNNQNLVPGSSHLSAVPFGVSIKTTIERGDAYSAPEIYDLEITLLEVIRGVDARERIKVQSIANELPKAGFEYLLVRIELAYSRRGRGLEDEAYKLTEGQFAAVSADGQTEYMIPAVLPQPQPQLVDTIFHSGESREGWILLQVPEDEKKPLLVYKREHVEGVYGIWRHVWFQLYQQV